MRIDGIQAGSPIGIPGYPGKINHSADVPSFKDTLATFLTEVNASQKVASDAQVRLLAGEITDVHQVAAKSEEAKIGFNMLMELRNKSMDGYQELIRMRL